MRSACTGLLGFAFALAATSAHSEALQDQSKVETVTTTTEMVVPLEPESILQIKAQGEATFGRSDSKSMSQSADLRQCGMQWHRDDGRYSVWRPTVPVFIVVTVVRNGKVTGSVNHTVRPPNQEISLLMNMDGSNWDGVHSCTRTI